MNQKPIIALPDPRREWLLHCTADNGELGVCSIAAESGVIAVYPPVDSGHFTLIPTAIAEFRAALMAAIEVTEVDLQAKADREAKAT